MWHTLLFLWLFPQCALQHCVHGKQSSLDYERGHFRSISPFQSIVLVLNMKTHSGFSLQEARSIFAVGKAPFSDYNVYLILVFFVV